MTLRLSAAILSSAEDGALDWTFCCAAGWESGHTAGLVVGGSAEGAPSNLSNSRFRFRPALGPGGGRLLEVESWPVSWAGGAGLSEESSVTTITLALSQAAMTAGASVLDPGLPLVGRQVPGGRPGPLHVAGGGSAPVKATSGLSDMDVLAFFFFGAGVKSRACHQSVSLRPRELGIDVTVTLLSILTLRFVPC